MRLNFLSSLWHFHFSMRTIKWELVTSSIHFLTMSILLSFVCLWSSSVMFDSWRPHGLQPTRLLCLWPGIFQARVLEWVAISFSRRSSWPRDRTQVSHIVGRHLTIWATREVAFYYFFFCLYMLPELYPQSVNLCFYITQKYQLWWYSNLSVSSLDLGP